MTEPLLSVARLSPREIVANDDRLLAAGHPAACVAILAGPGLTLGVSQSARSATAERARARGLPVVHRSTGGTAVLSHEGDLAWTVILPRSDPRVGRDYVRAYARFGGPVADELSHRGFPTEWVAAPGLNDDLCVLSSRGQVLRSGQRIVGGAAQHVTARALLHHGFVARAIDWSLMHEVFDLPSELLRREMAGWQELGIDAAPEELGGSLYRRLERELARSG